MDYEFDKHTPSEGTIAAQADAVAKPAGDVESFTGDVTAAHNKSKSTVEGALLTAMTGADEPTKKQARDLVQGITVASAAVRNYATAVGEHNATVDNLNSQIRQEPTQEKKKKKHTALTGKFTNSEETLTEVGRASGRQLNDPLNPENVK
ncbi:MAG: hypothetical protein L0H93_13845, partial [Nocardioides sp.]|nr:hypothetical protein [Nocardioides sp.]